MGNQHIHPVIAAILDAACSPRSARQLEIERKIDAFRPDWSEAEEILNALMASLEGRYDHALLDDAKHYAAYLGKALERAELAQSEPYINSADYHNDYPDRE